MFVCVCVSVFPISDSGHLLDVEKTNIRSLLRHYFFKMSLEMGGGRELFL